MPGIRFTDPRAQALLSALCVFRLLPHGFTNRDLRDLLEHLLGQPPGALTRGRVTYDLRRLRHHGLIERVPGSHRYQVTDTGHSQALFLTRAHDRLLRDGLAQIAHTPTEFTTRLRTADRAYNQAVTQLLTSGGLAA